MCAFKVSLIDQVGEVAPDGRLRSAKRARQLLDRGHLVLSQVLDDQRVPLRRK
jgi:hypothetical protein